MWEVQTWSVCGGWENNWTVTERDGTSGPQYFDTYQEALHELAEFFDDVREMIEREGYTWEEYGYDPEDFRIVYIEPMAEAV